MSLPGTGKLRQDFNEAFSTVRLVAVLSPTCPHCLEGYHLVRRMSAGPTCFVLWTAMLDGDSVGTAMDQITSDQRCINYWEDEGWPVSSSLRQVLGLGPYDHRRSVWDVYLLYRPAIVWTGASPPLPSEWTHNLAEPAAPDRPRISAALLSRWSSMRWTDN